MSVKSNTDYWRPKLTRNRERDINNIATLEVAGWNVCIVWEYQAKGEAQIAALVSEVRAMKKALMRGAGNDAHCD